MEKVRKRRFPPIGQRIIKTALAVFLCFVIYMLRGYRGMVSQSAIAAIICMQPYSSDSRKLARNRVMGTVMGGLWGLGFLWLMEAMPSVAVRMEMVYLLMAVGVALVLYSAVVMDFSSSAALAAIVFLCVIITYPDIEAPLKQTGDRIFDTIIGVTIAIFINTFHLPMERNSEKVFFVRMQDLVEDRYSQISSRVMIELNRLYDDGARICLVSQWAPAFLLSQMGFLKINLPVIVMDGAALYDIRENTYYEVKAIPHEDVALLVGYLSDMGLCSQITSVRGSTMFFYHRGETSQAEIEDFRMMRRSPYRNYVEGDLQEEDQVARVRFIVEESAAEEYEKKLDEIPEIKERFRIVRLIQPRMDHYIGFYFYRKDVSVLDMAESVLADARNHGPAEPEYILPQGFIYEPDRDAPILLNRIRKMYERPSVRALFKKKSK